MHSSVQSLARAVAITAGAVAWLALAGPASAGQTQAADTPAPGYAGEKTCLT